MVVPGTRVLGAAKKRFSVAASQVNMEARNAGLYAKFGTLAAERPITPTSDGPCAPPLSSASAEWQMAQRCLNICLPSAASAARATEQSKAAPSTKIEINSLFKAAPRVTLREI